MSLRAIGESELRRSPYPHVAIEGALTDYAALLQAFPEEGQFGPQLRMHGDLTYPEPNYMALVEGEPSYRAFHDWVYSPDFIRRFLAVFDEPIQRALDAGELRFDPRSLPIRPEPFEFRDELISPDNVQDGEAFLFPRLDLGIGRKDYGLVNGGAGIHVDNLTRLVSVLVYMDDNTTMEGGEHRMYRLEGLNPVIEHVYRPAGNLMVASLQSNLALHDVNPVTAITGVRKAMYMAVSCSTELWVPHSDRRIQRLTKSRYRASGIERGANQIKRLVRKILPA